MKVTAITNLTQDQYGNIYMDIYRKDMQSLLDSGGADAKPFISVRLIPNKKSNKFSHMPVLVERGKSSTCKID